MTKRFFFVAVALSLFSFAPAGAFAQSCTSPDTCVSGGNCPSGYGPNYSGFCNDPSQTCCHYTGGGTTPNPGNNGNNGGVTPNPGNNGNNGVTLLNPLQGGASLESFLNSILAFVVRIGTIVVILMLVFVGYKFVAAQGEPGKLEEARRMLLWTVIGALILLGAQVISSGIQATVNALSTGG